MRHIKEQYCQREELERTLEGYAKAREVDVIRNQIAHMPTNASMEDRFRRMTELLN